MCPFFHLSSPPCSILCLCRSRELIFGWICLYMCLPRYTSVRRDFILPVNKERREMVGNIILYFSTLSSAYRLKVPLPPYLPPAEKARQNLVRRTLAFTTPYIDLVAHFTSWFLLLSLRSMPYVDSTSSRTEISESRVSSCFSRMHSLCRASPKNWITLGVRRRMRSG